MWPPHVNLQRGFAMRTRSITLWITSVLVAACTAGLVLAQESARSGARIWVGQESDIESFLKTAKVVDLTDIGVGVTRPRRAKLAPGGPVDAMAWKAIKPGRYSGYWESYKSEIAAYELDKYFGLGMIPPTVERTVNGETGAAVMWASPTQSFKDLGGVPGQKGVKAPPSSKIGLWNLQISRAKMFDNLIGNIDPNLGNWLVDPEWNLILIDHTRAFTGSRNLYHQMSGIDTELWQKMDALDEATLTRVVGTWLDRSAIRSMLERRDKMREAIAKLKR
jgi:hypothetical protein